MNQNNLRPLLLLALLLSSFSTLIGQEIKDTVYFDEDFSICEKPVAEYYRICVLNRTDNIFYKGKVEDYFIDGRLKMTGDYADNGFKDGEFVFYNENGSISKKGSYKDDEMVGNWFYYDPSGNLHVIFKCKSSRDFTPIFFINHSGDTLLKDGNGKFVFETKKDLSYIIPELLSCTVEGEVTDSLKNGVFNYYISAGDKKTTNSETYKDGKFIKGHKESLAFGTANITQPFIFLNIGDNYLDKIDRFFHTNLVFGTSAEGDKKVIDFLLNNTFPEINASANSFTDNYNILFSVISEVLKNSLPKNNYTQFSDISFEKKPFEIYKNLIIADNEKESIRKINGDIVATIDTSGYIANSGFKASLSKPEIEKINYYLLHVSNLVPYKNGKEKVPVNINFRLKTIFDSLKNDSLQVKYIVYNADSIREDALADMIEPIIPPSFPGGDKAWSRFLHTNFIPRSTSRGTGPLSSNITVSYLIDSTGNIKDVKVTGNADYIFVAQAVRVIQLSPKWHPATKKGKPVDYRMVQDFVITDRNF